MLHVRRGRAGNRKRHSTVRLLWVREGFPPAVPRSACRSFPSRGRGLDVRTGVSPLTRTSNMGCVRRQEFRRRETRLALLRSSDTLVCCKASPHSVAQSPTLRVVRVWVAVLGLQRRAGAGQRLRRWGTPAHIVAHPFSGAGDCRGCDGDSGGLGGRFGFRSGAIGTRVI